MNFVSSDTNFNIVKNLKCHFRKKKIKTTFSMFPLRTINKLKFRLTAKLDMKDTSPIETAQQKFENLINVRRDIIQRVPLTHIASYLGTTLETLRRIRYPKNRI